MKTVFLTIYEGDIAKNIFRTDVWKILKRTNGIRFVLLVPPQKKEYYAGQFGGENIYVEPFEKIYLSSPFKIVQALYRNALPVNTTAIRHRYLISKSKKNIPKYLFFRLIYFLSHIRLMQKWMRNLGALFLPSRSLGYLFEKYEPDLIFAANIIAYEEGNLISEASKRGVETVGMIKSWDTTSTKGLLRAFPDSLIAPNYRVAEELEKLHNFPRDRIFVSGVPQYDAYFRREGVKPREKFLADIGADPEKKLIFYCAIGDWLAPHEDEYIEIIDKAITLGKIRFPSQILVRPHPKYTSIDGKLEGCDNIIFDRPGKYLGPDISGWEFEKDDIEHLANSLAHCDVLITTASSMTIEACIFDKPVINILFDGYRKEKPALSVARFHDLDHYKPLIESGGVKIADSPERLVGIVNQYLASPSLDSEGRRVIQNMQCVWPDGKSGERIARYILSHI